MADAQIVLAYTPSINKKDWRLQHDGSWFYEQRVRFYDTGCKELKAYCTDHKRATGREPYFDLIANEITSPPRIYINHYPEKGEWESCKTVDDIRKSPLYVSG